MGRSSIAGRVVVVTGASAGNGRATAEQLQARGATVVGCARDGDRLHAAAAEGGGWLPVVCDVTGAGQREQLVSSVLASHGRIDALVNNAGVATVGMLVDLSSADLERLFATNVTAVADLTRLVLPGMLERGDGDVVMMSSVGAWASVPPIVAYCASKFAVDGLVEGLRREVHGRGARIHSVNPGPVATEWLSRAAWYQPGEGDQAAALSPGVPARWVADAVVTCLQAGRSRTVAVPRSAGIARLASLPPVGALLDAVLGSAAPAIVRQGQRMVGRRTPPGF